MADFTESAFKPLSDYADKRNAKWETTRQEKMAVYEAQREAFIPCSPELKEVLCSESPKNHKKITTKVLVVWPSGGVLREALENVIPMRQNLLPFPPGKKLMMFTSTSLQYRFRLYTRSSSWGTIFRVNLQRREWNTSARLREDIPLWDLEVRFLESDPENLQRAISIMIPRFQKVIE